jgi:inosine-uridine nucleoside N-ribohydrolase
MKKSVPVILDTDIGADIDDTWALVMLLHSPELDVKLISADSEYGAAIVARILEVSRRSLDIPVSIGKSRGPEYNRQRKWVESFDLAKYPGLINHDGPGAIIHLTRSRSLA